MKVGDKITFAFGDGEKEGSNRKAFCQKGFSES